MVDPIRRYKSSDYETLCRWFKNRRIKAPKPELLPDTGLICDDVGAGFLYLAEEKIGILDFFITNPRSDSKTRDQVLDQITTALMVFAKLAKLQGVLCTTQVPKIKERALKHGFKDLGQFTSLFRGF